MGLLRALLAVPQGGAPWTYRTLMLKSFRIENRIERPEAVQRSKSRHFIAAVCWFLEWSNGTASNPCCLKALESFAEPAQSSMHTNSDMLRPAYGRESNDFEEDSADLKVSAISACC